jgi:hypothetical protein
MVLRKEAGIVRQGTRKYNKEREKNKRASKKVFLGDEC